MDLADIRPDAQRLAVPFHLLFVLAHAAANVAQKIMRGVRFGIGFADFSQNTQRPDVVPADHQDHAFVKSVAVLPFVGEQVADLVHQPPDDLVGFLEPRDLFRQFRILLTQLLPERRPGVVVRGEYGFGCFGYCRLHGKKEG